MSGVTLVDASGLSRENQVPTRVVADVLALGLGDRLPAMRSVVGATSPWAVSPAR